MKAIYLMVSVLMLQREFDPFNSNMYYKSTFLQKEVKIVMKINIISKQCLRNKHVFKIQFKTFLQVET